MWALAVTVFQLWGSAYTAHSAVLEKSGTEGTHTYLFCQNDGKVTWEKGVDGGRLAILTAQKDEGVLKHQPDHRYSVLSDLSLYIRDLSLSDSGIYYCNSTPVVYLTVTPLQRSVAETDVDSAEKGMKTPPTMANVSGATQEKDDDDHDNDDEELDAWSVAAVVGMSCVLLLLVGLLVWGVFSRRKGGQQNQVHLYNSVNYFPEAPQPEFIVTQNQAHVYASIGELSEASQCDGEQSQSETVYFLAQNPTPNTTDDQERGENKAVYSQATAPVFNTTDQSQTEQLYAMIQKPANNTGPLSLQHY